jgi:hypothetical protein
MRIDWTTEQTSLNCDLPYSAQPLGALVQQVTGTSLKRRIRGFHTWLNHSGHHVQNKRFFPVKHLGQSGFWAMLCNGPTGSLLGDLLITITGS